MRNNAKETAFYLNGCNLTEGNNSFSLATYIIQKEGDDFAAKIKHSESSLAGKVHIDANCTFVPVGAINLDAAKPISFDALPDGARMAYRGALRERGTVRVVKPTNPTIRFLDFFLNGVVGPIELGPLDVVALMFERREIDPMGYVTLGDWSHGTGSDYQRGPNVTGAQSDQATEKRTQFTGGSKPASVGACGLFEVSMPGVSTKGHYDPNSYPGRCYAAAEEFSLPYDAIYAVGPENAQALNAVWQSEAFQRKVRDMSQPKGILHSDNPETISWGLLNLFNGYRCITDKLNRIQNGKRARLAAAIVKHFGGKGKK